MVEFKEHPEKKKLYLLEINPRPWGSITLPISAGLNYPLEAVKVFLDPDNYKIPKEELEYNERKDYYMRWFLPGDFLSIVLDKKMSINQKIKNLFKRYKNTEYQILSRKDPLPALVMVLKLLLNAFNLRYIRKYILRKW
jgi:predicted ATP-grasp superfamily ATP-dependent carboligase